jgi:hypothetical protein
MAASDNVVALELLTGTWARRRVFLPATADRLILRSALPQSRGFLLSAWGRFSSKGSLSRHILTASQALKASLF